jgi:ABC-type branched-subunit amino acid transport system permease subunit
MTICELPNNVFGKLLFIPCAPCSLNLESGFVGVCSFGNVHNFCTGLYS